MLTAPLACESKNTPEPAQAESTAPAADTGAATPTPIEADTVAAGTPTPADAAEEPASRMNGRAIADPKDYENPDETALGTRPEGVGLAPGEVVGDFAVMDVNGERVTRDNLVAEGPLLVVFYRGGW